jgi:hypothetical protein
MREPNLHNGQSNPRRKASGQVILVAALLSVVFTFIATPRPTVPHVLPLPRFDLAAARRSEAQERTRAARVRDGRLPNSIRAVGEQVRRLGLTIYQRTNISLTPLQQLKFDVRELLLARHEEELRDLRALQADLFLAAVTESLKQGAPTLDLQELGGEFPHLLFSVWLSEERSCLLDADALQLMFRAHFNRLTGLHDHPTLGPSLEDLRRYYALLLEFPTVEEHDVHGAAALQLRYATALAKVDPSYDPRLVQGILSLRLDQPGHASKYFDEFLMDHPNGSFSHLARGHLKWALARAQALTLDSE